MRSSKTQSRVYMDTVVNIEICGFAPDLEFDELVEVAFGWFGAVEACCSRFDPASELSRLCQHIGQPFRVSPMLHSLVAFAVRVAELTDGAFDPTVGHAMAGLGFNRNYLTGARVEAAADYETSATYRDVQLNADGSITLLRQLILDLGAVAKGFAIDLAAMALAPLAGFVINAGGDIYVHGRNADDTPWRIGIRDPQIEGSMLKVLQMEDGAICTSGDYERRSEDGSQHHLLTPDSGGSALQSSSVTVVAPSAMLADAASTAAFVLGPEEGMRFLESQSLDGLILTPDRRLIETKDLHRYFACP